MILKKSLAINGMAINIIVASSEEINEGKEEKRTDLDNSFILTFHLQVFTYSF